MKRFLLASLALGAALASTLCAAPTVTLSSVATVDSSSVILDVYADPGDNQLRSFGIRILFDPAGLTIRGGGRYDGLWFLADERGSHFIHGTPTELSPGVLRIVGGRLSGQAPAAGVGGGPLLLATVEFDRLNGNTPGFSFALASPPPFANFVNTDGINLDAGVEGFTTAAVQQSASPDSDRDGLPDDYELATFGDLGSSDGSGDADGDGESDKAEFCAGTDPTSPSSRLQLRLSNGPGGPLLDWDSMPGRVYRVDWSPDLEVFGVAVDGLPATPALNQLAAPHFPDLDQAFYRLYVDNPTKGR